MEPPRTGHRAQVAGDRLQGLRAKGKAAFEAAFFFFYSISSEYQAGADLLPGLGGYFGGEVLLYQRLLL